MIRRCVLNDQANKDLNMSSNVLILRARHSYYRLMDLTAEESRVTRHMKLTTCREASSEPRPLSSDRAQALIELGLGLNCPWISVKQPSIRTFRGKALLSSFEIISCFCNFLNKLKHIEKNHKYVAEQLLGHRVSLSVARMPKTSQRSKTVRL